MNFLGLGGAGMGFQSGTGRVPCPGMFSGVHYPAAHSICERTSRCSSRVITGNGWGRELGRLPKLSLMGLLKSRDPSAIPGISGMLLGRDEKGEAISVGDTKGESGRERNGKDLKDGIQACPEIHLRMIQPGSEGSQPG